MDDSAKYLLGYLKNSAESGSEFEIYDCENNEPNRLTAGDFIAVTLMSIHISPGTKSGITPWSILALKNRFSGIEYQLARIPVDWRLEKITDDEFKIAEECRQAIWASLIKAKISSARVAKYKLLARKRPLLFPVADSVVCKQLGIPSTDPDLWHKAWRNAFKSDQGEIVSKLEKIRSQVPEAAHLGLLRVADIVIWARAKRP